MANTRTYLPSPAAAASRVMYAARTKQASSLAGWFKPEADGLQLNDTQQLETKKNFTDLLLRLGMAGVGTGIAARGIPALLNALSPPAEHDPEAYTSPIPTSLAIPTKPKAKPKQRLLAKQAGAGEAYTAFRDWLAKSLPNSVNPDYSHSSIGMPLAVGAPIAAAAGGWALTDHVLKRKRQADADDEMAEAERDYESAISDQYARGISQKRAAAVSPAAASIDAVFSAYLTKQAIESGEGVLGTIQSIYETLAGKKNVDSSKGLFNTAMAATLLGGGALGYKWQKGRGAEAALNAAIRERARRRQATSPVRMTMRRLSQSEPIEA